MTLKKLSSKNIGTVLTTQLYQMRMLLILFGLVLLICPTLLTLGEFTNRYWAQYNAEDVKESIHAFAGLMGFSPMFGLGVSMAVAQFGYLHRRQKLDYFHALPVRRAEHFSGRVLAALTSLVGAAVIVALGQTFAVAVTLGWADAEVYGYIWYLCLMFVVPALAAYLFTVLIIVLTATLWETVFSLLAVSAVYPAAALLIYMLVSYSIPVNDFEVNWDGATVASPLLFCVGYVLALLRGQDEFNIVFCAAVTVLHILICGGLAMRFFCNRKSELAESGGKTRFKHVVRFSAAFCAAALFSVIFLWITNVYAGYLFGSVLGLVLAWLVLELLYTRSLRGVMRCVVPNLTGFVLFLVLNLLVAVGAVGVPRVPEVAEINAAAVEYGREVWQEDCAEYENFYGNHEWVYTDVEARSVTMGTFDSELISDAQALTAAMLENQKDLYFPYIPTQWGERRNGNYTDTYEHYDVTVRLYTEQDVLSLRYGDYAQNGQMTELFEQAQAIASAPAYKQSNPSLPIMELLDHVVYMNYTKSEAEQTYTLENIADTEDFIARLQAAYLEDMYSPNVETYETDEVYTEYSDAGGAMITTESAEAVPIEVTEDNYTLFFKVTEPVVLRGGIIDARYPAEGLKCWLLPHFTPDYTGEMPNAETLSNMGTNMYFYRADYPKTCAVLDELRQAEE